MNGAYNNQMEKGIPYPNLGARRISYREQLLNNINHHQRELEKHKRLLDLLDENPAIAEFVELTR